MSRIVAFAAILLLTPLTGAASVQVVDCVEGPFFDVGPAVEAAAPGDTVLVRPCASRPYAPFEIVDKPRLHVVASRVGGPAPVIDGTGGPIDCVRIVNSDRVAIESLEIVDCSFQGIVVEGGHDVVLYGNRFRDAGEEVIRDGGVRTRVVDNEILRGGHGIFLVGVDAFVAGNVVRDAFSGIQMVTGQHHVVGNTLIGNRGDGIFDQGDDARIERNVALGNGPVGGSGEIQVHFFSERATVVGNVTRDGIIDSSDTSVLVDNR